MGIGVVAPAAARPPSPGAAPAVTSISISANNFFFSPNSLGPLAVGSNITLTLHQLASTGHTFTLSSLANYTLPAQASASNLTTFFTTHPPVVNVSLNGTVGETHVVTFALHTTGFYEFLCLVGGHFQSGMFGFLGYGVTPPNALPETGPGAPVFIIGGTIVGLVILALVLAFVIGRREGAKHEMPPERLGYPEPASGSVPLPGPPKS
jgi:plastocyanin